MKDYMNALVRKIEIDKRYGGIRQKRDSGIGFFLAWTQKNGLWFRKTWDQCVCKDCRLSSECGHNVKDECREYQDSEFCEAGSQSICEEKHPFNSQ